MTTTPEQRTKLKAAAEAAPAGPWTAAIWRHVGGSDTVCIKDSEDREIIGWSGFDGVPLTKAKIRALARWIALANPETILALLAEIEALEARVASAEGATHRHKKRGSEYRLLGIGKVQAGNWYELDEYGEPIGNTVDMREVAVYRSVDDGSLWVRPREEFEDGRFEAISFERAHFQSQGGDHGRD